MHGVPNDTKGDTQWLSLESIYTAHWRVVVQGKYE